MRFLIYFVFLPLIGLAQDIPLTEKKVTTDKIEKRDRVFLEKTPPEIINSVMPDRRLYPMKQIGYISNHLEAPFGLNFFTLKIISLDFTSSKNRFQCLCSRRMGLKR